MAAKTKGLWITTVWREEQHTVRRGGIPFFLKQDERCLGATAGHDWRLGTRSTDRHSPTQIILSPLCVSPDATQIGRPWKTQTKGMIAVVLGRGIC